jgi:hypothetical protein
MTGYIVNDIQFSIPFKIIIWWKIIVIICTFIIYPDAAFQWVGSGRVAFKRLKRSSFGMAIKLLTPAYSNFLICVIDNSLCNEKLVVKSEVIWSGLWPGHTFVLSLRCILGLVRFTQRSQWFSVWITEQFLSMKPTSQDTRVLYLYDRSPF